MILFVFPNFYSISFIVSKISLGSFLSSIKTTFSIKYVSVANRSTTKKIKEQIDTNKYTLHSDSVYDENQKNVLVSNTEEKSLGVLNVKSKEYKAIYAYKQNKSYFYSTVSDIDSNDKNNAILKISCSESSCDEKKTVIYDMKNNKSLYKSEGINVSDYKEYEGGYKVIDFSSDKSNKYGSKNVVFDKKVSSVLYTL